MKDHMNKISNRIGITNWLIRSFSFLFVAYGLGFACPYEIVFKDSVVVPTSQVTLGEIAHITGCGPVEVKRMESIPVCNSLLPGLARILNPQYIIAQYLQNMSPKELQVHSRGKVIVKMDFQEIPISLIQNQVNEYVYGHSAYKKENVKIRYTRCPETIIIGNSPYRINIKHDAEYDFRGTSKIIVEFIQAEKAVKTVPVSVEIQVREMVCMAKRNIPRNTLLSREDLDVALVDITRMRNKPVLNPEIILGKQAGRTLCKGRILDETMFESPPLVKAGDRVKIQVREGATTIAADGICKGDGRENEEVPVFCLASNKLLKGRVISGGNILIESTRSIP
jgi:flagella basal body P-ring formation protein FlgA